MKVRGRSHATGAGANARPLDHGASYGVRTKRSVDVEGVTGAYNEVVARVVAARGAILVDLHAAGVAARSEGKAGAMVAADDFHPSTAGHAAIADAFASATAPRV